MPTFVHSFCAHLSCLPEFHRCLISLVRVQARIKADEVDMGRLTHLPFGSSEGGGTDAAHPPIHTPRDPVINAIPGVPAEIIGSLLCTHAFLLTLLSRRRGKKYILWGAHEIWVISPCSQAGGWAPHLPVCLFSEEPGHLIVVVWCLLPP